MRIRTIKPEFWSHPILAKLPDRSRLLAIGLLSLADDEGYFLADPALIRSAIFPFTESSLNIHGVLTELSNAEYIALREHASHGSIGRVINFSKHQVVNRPSPSKIKTYWDSGKTHGALTERSVPEQGKEQGTGKGKDLAPDKPARARNPLFDALAEACGADPAQMPARQARACGVALAEIRKACPSVDPPEFARRAERYRRLYRDAALTPSALCAHWAECGNGVHPPAAPAGIPEPPDWRARLHERCPEAIVLADSRPWEKLPRDQQQGIAAALA